MAKARTRFFTLSATCEAGISASSTAAASDHENPEQTHEPGRLFHAPGATPRPSRTNSPGPEDSRSLPSIRHERRKVAGQEEDGHDDGMAPRLLDAAQRAVAKRCFLRSVGSRASATAR